MRHTRPFVALLTLLVGGAAVTGQAPPGDDQAVAFFEKKVRPVLVANCFNCHSANTNSRGGLRVDDRTGLLTGGNGGPAVVPGHPEKSLLVKAIHYRDGLKMPPKKQLSDEQIADLTRWIKDGAAWPKVQVPVALGKSGANYDKLKKEHWAWQPLRETTVPLTSGPSWARTTIDRFVLAGLEQKGLKPVADADRTALIRRVTFDLTGLPPTPAEIDAFTSDPSANAFEKVVDRLLQSPAFGERWGRHWLDVARYGESTGSSRNVPYPHAWRYRDYVLDAFNRDKPYDRFVQEQVAGDLLPSDTPTQRDEQRVATGFLALGVKDVNQRFKVRFVMDNIDEQIDTVTRAVLGVTASCARCHDHKFDPIPQAEYYALAGIFHSTDLCAGVRSKMGGGGLDYYDPSLLVALSTQRPAPPAEQVAKLKQDYEKALAEWNAIRGTPAGLARAANGQPTQRPYRLKMERLRAEYLAASDPAARGDAAHGVRDAKAVGDTRLRVRGEAEQLGPVVPRGFLSVLPVPDAPKVSTAQSGRLELARWLTSDRNPLTPRVLVNRVWHHLFGAGLVSSVDNFGVTGAAPSHPELLDHLAGQFVRDGWWVKKLVRAIVLSRVYQLGTDAPRANTEVDPANRLLWRHAPRRLSAEEIRDATLAAAGTLDRRRPAGSPAMEFKVMEMRNNGPEARRLANQARDSRYRGVYLPLLRGLTPTSLEVFDPAEQGMVSGSRSGTTVAPQALYLLNDPFVRRQSLALAERLIGRSDLDDSGRIDSAYRLTLGRSATAKERERARQYVEAYTAAAEEVRAGKPDARPEAKPAVAVARPNRPVPVNPDEIDQTDEPVSEVEIRPSSPKAAAWGSFCQALIASAEFRYLQ